MSARPPNPDHAEMLRAVALRGLGGTPLAEPATREQRLRWLDGFVDEYQNRRTTDRPLLARLLRIDPGPTPDRPPAPTALLWAAHDPATDPDALLLDRTSPGTPAPLIHDPADDSVAIEWRTLDELSALHALWNLTLTPGPLPETARARWASRCLDAARWHVAELQPDNATNHPWAVHVFYELARVEPDPSSASAARFHAETLLHNCQVQHGRPDVVSACILLDAANGLGLSPNPAC